MAKRGLGTEPVYRREFREVHLCRGLKRKVFQGLVPALVVGRPTKSEGVEGLEVLPAELAAFLPRHAADRVGLPVGDGYVAVPALLDVPDDLFHDHQVPEVREA